MSSDAEQTSRYRRIQRFFAMFSIDFDMVAGFIFKLFFVSGGKGYLTMDRTNWQWGKSDINILSRTEKLGITSAYFGPNSNN
ncbi:MAG: hypothetical protein ACHP65_09045 [Legionellales bacterium]